MRRHPATLALLVLGVGATLAVIAEAAFRLTPNTKSLVVTGVPFAAFLVAGGLAFQRRPAHLAARRLAAIGPLLLASSALDGWGRPVHATSQFAAYLGLACWVALLAVFPDGLYQARYERIVVAAFAVAAVAIASAEALSGREIVLQFAFLLGGFALLATRYRRFGPEQRVQIRWPLATLLIVALFFVLGAVSGSPSPAWVADVMFVTLFSAVPVGLVVGMLRHRLFDIDLVVRGSVLYAALWLAIGAAYFGIAGALGVAAGRGSSATSAVVVTLLVTVVFLPVRRLLERLASRWVHGERLDQYELLRRFGATLENTADVAALAPTAAAAIREGLGARWVRIRDDSGQVLGDTGVAEGDEEAVIVEPLVRDGESLGVIECGPRTRSEYVGADRELLAVLAPQVSAALRNATLASELAVSRARIVRADELARRRIERDIHDGVQQELVALITKVRLTRNRVERGGDSVLSTLAELQGDVERTLDDLRTLSQGIHPIALTAGGVVAAVEERITRLPIDVELRVADELRCSRFAPEVEGAAFFFICEGLANAMKHAKVNRVELRFEHLGGRLVIEVQDHGCGFDSRREHGSGLDGLSDRIGGIGGQMCVRSAPGRGTRLEASIPVG